jgi:hypothetical protein
MKDLSRREFLKISCISAGTMLPFANFVSALEDRSSSSKSTKSVSWEGRGRYRILVKIDPFNIGNRKFDEMPAEMVIKALDIQKKFRVQGKLDIASIQVMRYSLPTGKAIPYGKYAYATSPYDIPFRWYDDAIPYDFPEFESDIDQTNGVITYINHPRWGYFYNVLGDWDSGKLAWLHTQEGDQSSYYAIYFNLLAPGKEPEEMPPAGWIGDGIDRCDKVGEGSTGLLHTRVCVNDWNEDGLLDLIIGCARGGILWFPNKGTKTQPYFPYAKILFTENGKPLDVGWSSAPFVVDWDGDGVKDLITGAEWNRMLFYKNVGTNKNPQLVYKGFIKDENGDPIILPFAPNVVPRGTEIYKRDYYPIPEVVDWDGDGRPDLLLGGYVTGLIFWYKNVGTNTDGTPKLRYQGWLKDKDGKNLNNGWCASPCIADLEGNGKLDVIMGCMPITAGGGDSSSSENFLLYYKNIGTRTNPILEKQPFPKIGTFPSSSLGTPRLADLFGNGLLDLVVSYNSEISLYKNIGTKTAPLFDVENSKPLPARWGSAPYSMWGTQFIDWNNDGLIDMVNGFTVQLNLGKGNPYIFGNSQSILPPGEKISHLSHIGDDWEFTQVADLTGDGKLDILYGDHAGTIWFHRNLGSKQNQHFDTVGVRLKMIDGKDIEVGPVKGQAFDFEVLQGARIMFTVADFDNDGKNDLVVGDNYGKVRYYRNSGKADSGGVPIFEEPVLLGDMVTRLNPVATDWDHRGWMDVIGSSASGKVQLFRNLGSQAKDKKSQFAPPVDLPIPALPFEPHAYVVDLNGDGDDDLIIQTEYDYTCWVERSFLEHGYAEGNPLSIERK